MLDFLLNFFGLRISGFRRKEKFWLYLLKIRYSIFLRNSLNYFFAMCFSCAIFFYSPLNQNIKNIFYNYSINTKIFCDDVVLFCKKVFHYIIENNALKHEIQKLILKNTILQKENIYLNSLRQEVQNLKDSLNFNYDFENTNSIEKVLGFEGNAYSTPMIITISSNNCEKGAAVLSSDGIVGIISYINDKFASVVHIYDSKFKIAVKTETGMHMILHGNGNGKMEICDLGKLDVSKFSNNELLTTSGEGCIFPKEIPVARIKVLQQNNIEIIPVVDIYKIKFVWVLSIINRKINNKHSIN